MEKLSKKIIFVWWVPLSIVSCAGAKNPPIDILPDNAAPRVIKIQNGTIQFFEENEVGVLTVDPEISKFDGWYLFSPGQVFRIYESLKLCPEKTVSAPTLSK